MSATKEQEYYIKMLGILGSLTGLFSESSTPYLNYRITENLFCKSFSAKNLSRADVSVDAIINDTGFGIKTFINKNGQTFQKIAEFNKDNISFRGLNHNKLIKKITDLRNERIDTTKRIYGLNKLKYHCIVREKENILVYECDMNLIETEKIKHLKSNKNITVFKDSKNEYAFNNSKSTLYKRFITDNILIKIPVKILDDPFEVIEQKFTEIKEVDYKKTKENPYVILPLYSKTKDGKAVYPKSGLNQWNAGGRKRDYNEIYIPIPKWIHKRFPEFFLPRDKPFNLILPNGNILSAKVCQDGSKALMSRHNADLGNWLLRDVLNIKEGKLLTYEKLQKIGLDSVIIERIDSQTYSIDFRLIGVYEEFIEENT